MRRIFPYLMILSVAACKKSDPVNPPDPGAARIIATSNSLQPGTETYAYDKNNRLTSYDYDSGTVRYIYSDTAVRIDGNTKPGGIPYAAELYHLDAKGLATSLILPATDRREMYYYDYNADGYLMNSRHVYLSNNTSWYTGDESRYYRTNNVIDSMDYFYNTLDAMGNTLQSNLVDRAYYQYYTDKKSTIDNPNFGMAFLGRLHQYPLKMIVRHFPGYYNDTIRYSYIYDARQNITQLILDETPQNRLVFNYSYR